MQRARIAIEDSFRPGPSERWRRMLIGEGALIVHERGLRLALPRASSAHYSNAQIDDYGGLPRRLYPWRPPLLLTMRARFSGPLLGTAGFGFWNHPFVPMGGIPMLPRAIWFFYSAPPTHLPLASGVPGTGWKVGTIDAVRPAALRWAPIAPLLALLNRWPALERRIWPIVQRDLQIAEALVPAALDQWHEYQLEWRPDGARFSVDG